MFLFKIFYNFINSIIDLNNNYYSNIKQKAEYIYSLYLKEDNITEEEHNQIINFIEDIIEENVLSNAITEFWYKKSHNYLDFINWLCGLILFDGDSSSFFVHISNNKKMFLKEQYIKKQLKGCDLIMIGDTLLLSDILINTKKTLNIFQIYKAKKDTEYQFNGDWDFKQSNSIEKENNPNLCLITLFSRNLETHDTLLERINTTSLSINPDIGIIGYSTILL